MEPNLNIVTFGLFCLPKSIFSNTILRLVISTWLNNTRVKTMSLYYLKACHLSHFFAIYGTKREWNIRSDGPALFAVWNSVSTQCILLSFLSCLNANPSTNKFNRNWKNAFVFLSEDFNNLELEIRGNWVDFQM